MSRDWLHLRQLTHFPGGGEGGGTVLHLDLSQLYSLLVVSRHYGLDWLYCTERRCTETMSPVSNRYLFVFSVSMMTRQASMNYRNQRYRQNQGVWRQENLRYPTSLLLNSKFQRVTWAERSRIPTWYIKQGSYLAVFFEDLLFAEGMVIHFHSFCFGRM